MLAAACLWKVAPDTFVADPEHILWCFVRTHRFSCPSSDVFEAWPLTGITFQSQERSDDFTILLVLHSHNASFCDIGMLDESFFDLGRIDIFTS